MNEMNINEHSNENDYNKNYYHTNKQKILQQMKQKVTCDKCNKSINRSHLNRHKNTKVCQLIHYKINNIKEKDDNIDVKDLQNELEAIKARLAQLKL